MQALKYMRTEDRPAAETVGQAASAVDPKPLVGTWMNTNAATRGLAKVILTQAGDEVKLRAFGSCEPSLCDWGEAVAEVFAHDVVSREAMAFSAFFDFGFMEANLQGHVRQGVLIIAKFDRFKDESGRSNYFTKEFFYKLPA